MKTRDLVLILVGAASFYLGTITGLLWMEADIAIAGRQVDFAIAKVDTANETMLHLQSLGLLLCPTP